MSRCYGSTVVPLVFSGSNYYAEIPAGRNPLDILIAIEEGGDSADCDSQLEILYNTGEDYGRTHRSPR